MDIAALSMNMAQSQVHSDVSVAVMNKSLDMLEAAGDGLLKIMEQSVAPDLGGNIDISI